MDREPFIAPDGSLVTELIRPDLGGSTNLSVARAVIRPGARTYRHTHETSEEVYYILAGEGLVVVGAAQHRVTPGSAILIPPGIEHFAISMGEADLVILCACSPPYQNADTLITEGLQA